MEKLLELALCLVYGIGIFILDTAIGAVILFFCVNYALCAWLTQIPYINYLQALGVCVILKMLKMPTGGFIRMRNKTNAT